MRTITEAEFIKIRDYVKSNFGTYLSDEKKTLVQSRLRSTMDELGFETFSDYFSYLQKDKTGEALTRFINKITTNHTFFMREFEHFDYFREVVLPYIEEKYSTKQDLSMWSAACSSGEEAVTMQIIAQEYFKGKGGVWDTQMLATDISAQVLDKAVAARYPIDSLRAMPKHWQLEHFKKVDSAVSQVADHIRRNILYRKFNLMENFNFKRRFQVIFCRNVMIYFDGQTRDALVKKFFEVTEPGGYLFIGLSESITGSGTSYEYVKPAIYRKPK